MWLSVCLGLLRSPGSVPVLLIFSSGLQDTKHQILTHCFRSEEWKLTQTWSLSSCTFFWSEKKCVSQTFRGSPHTPHWWEFSFMATCKCRTGKEDTPLSRSLSWRTDPEKGVSSQLTMPATIPSCVVQGYGYFYLHWASDCLGLDQWTSKCSIYQDHPENVFKYRFLGPIPMEFGGLPRDAEAAGPWTTLWVMLVQYPYWSHRHHYFSRIVKKKKLRTCQESYSFNTTIAPTTKNKN